MLACLPRSSTPFRTRSIAVYRYSTDGWADATVTLENVPSFRFSFGSRCEAKRSDCIDRLDKKKERENHKGCALTLDRSCCSCRNLLEHTQRHSTIHSFFYFIFYFALGEFWQRPSGCPSKTTSSGWRVTVGVDSTNSSKDSRTWPKEHLRSIFNRLPSLDSTNTCTVLYCPTLSYSVSTFKA